MKKAVVFYSVISLIVLTGVIITGLELKQYLYHSSDFLLKDIEIYPAARKFKHVQRADVLKAAGLKSTAIPAFNIFEVDLALIKNKLEALPWIERTEVRRVLPGRIELKIKEREGVARVKIKGRFFLVDADAVVLPDVQNIITYDFPLINVKGISSAEPKMGRVLNSSGLKSALVLLKKLRTTGFLAKYPVAAVSYQGKNGLFFALSHIKVEVRFPKEDYDPLIVILDKLLLELRDKINRVNYIDLRFKDPVIKER